MKLFNDTNYKNDNLSMIPTALMLELIIQLFKRMDNPYWQILETNIKSIGDPMNTELLMNILNHSLYILGIYIKK